MSTNHDSQTARRTNKIAQIFDSADSVEAYARQYADHMAEVVKALDCVLVAKASEIIERCAEEDKTFSILGNGGSGAVDAHWVNDLCTNTVVRGKLDEISQRPIHIPSTKDEYGPTEDIFNVIMHIIQSHISMHRGRCLAH